ncbi:MAG TPA: hypothetical protein VHR66_17020 [Gemmataceae bacterium]|jgi:hypothetical protein|nr:hypothetical protein [Gemmataceae bacterium]
MTVTATPPRPPLGLPPGSIRGLLALQITIIFWILLLAPTDENGTFVPIPLNLYFLLATVLVFFVAHGKSIARRDDPTPSPLWLPGGTLRFLILAGTGAVFAYLALRHPDRFDRLTPRPEDLLSWKYYLAAVGIGFVLGYATRVLPFRHGWAFQAFQAWIAIIAMAILFLHMVFEVIINFSMPHLIDAVAWQTIVTGVVAFYFGSRS